MGRTGTLYEPQEEGSQIIFISKEGKTLKLFITRFSQNHRMVEVGKHLWISPCPIPLLKKGHHSTKKLLCYTLCFPSFSTFMLVLQVVLYIYEIQVTYPEIILVQKC